MDQILHTYFDYNCTLSWVLCKSWDPIFTKTIYCRITLSLEPFFWRSYVPLLYNNDLWPPVLWPSIGTRGEYVSPDGGLSIGGYIRADRAP